MERDAGGGAGKQGAAKQGAAKQGGGAPATKSSQLIDAINWAIAENDRKDGQYYGKIDTSKVAEMGHSCGGIQERAFASGFDPTSGYPTGDVYITFSSP